ncbi:MAG: DUF1929 domain-containing protein [Pseudomonadota bacterium]|nr:DUF1929 domain-containing protein [Pseudomonadota bacterium]
MLSSGAVLVTGGTITIPQGIKAASSYNPLTNTWTRLPDMNAGRFYPTNATLANGDVVVISGNKEDASRNLIPQVWQVGSRSWRNLTSASVNLPLYPAAFLAPNGKTFVVGTALSYYVSTTGAGAVIAVAAQNASRRDNYGSAAMYDYGKVMYTGGGNTSDVPHSSVEMIDLTATNPVWTYAASMPQPRRQHNATLLPDGTVLVIGGSSASGANTNDGPKPAINWDPATNQWTIWATETRYRGYHSEALLLPDARVASVGGNGEASLQIFSPPYLFEPNRPEITSSPASVAYGAQFQVGTPHAADIGKVNLLRPGSVTHQNNMDQRICKLSFTTGANVLNVTAPSTGNICPPGHYLLFILNGSGVPSVAKFVQLVGTAAPDTPPPTDTPPPPDTTPPTDTPVPSPLPDVIVCSLSYASGVFTSTVKNQGTAATPAGIAIGVGYSVDGVFRTWGGVSGPLAAGASVTISTNGGRDTIPTGTHAITAYVDYVNGFAESDETNNQLSQPITVPLTCRGRVANISVSNNTIFGGPDSGAPYTGTLRGTNDNDVIVGTDANDSINGAGGNDIICGGAGRDTLGIAQK